MALARAGEASTPLRLDSQIIRHPARSLQLYCAHRVQAFQRIINRAKAEEMPVPSADSRYQLACSTHSEVVSRNWKP